MAKRDKRLDRIRQNPTNVMPAELDTLLVSLGFGSRQRGTSHRVYRHPLTMADRLVVPQHKPLRQYVVQQALAAIDSLPAEP